MSLSLTAARGADVGGQQCSRRVEGGRAQACERIPGDAAREARRQEEVAAGGCGLDVGIGAGVFGGLLDVDIGAGVFGVCWCAISRVSALMSHADSGVGCRVSVAHMAHGVPVHRL